MVYLSLPACVVFVFLNVSCHFVQWFFSLFFFLALNKLHPNSKPLKDTPPDC